MTSPMSNSAEKPIDLLIPKLVHQPIVKTKTRTRSKLKKRNAYLSTQSNSKRKQDKMVV
jgi:hypothetical protein